MERVDTLYITLGSASLVFLCFAVYFYFKFRESVNETKREREESARRVYEIAILKEIGERVGYSLDVEEILRIIVGSLRQFIDYTTVSYLVAKPEKLKISTQIERSISREFLTKIKQGMIDSLSALSGKSYQNFVVDESVTGAIVMDSASKEVGSLFNIPLVIGGSPVGVLTVAHTKRGLYKEADMTILYKITNQASQAVSRLQEVVRMEQGKLSSMVESMGDGVLMVDREYRILVANPAIKKAINFKKDHEISIFDFVDALGGKFDIHGKLEEALSKNVTSVSEKINMGLSFFEIGVYPVSYSSKLQQLVKTLGAVVVFHDVTKEIQIQKVRTEFTSMVVHELRSPLDGIKKIIELMISGAVEKDSPEQKEYLEMIHQSSSSMLELVNDILDLAKLQAGKFEVKKEEVNIRELIENRFSFYKVSANSRKIYLDTFFDKDLPQKSIIDPQAIRQSLNNFLSNAMKFTPPGGSVLISAFIYDGDETKYNTMVESIDRTKAPVFPTTTDIKIKSKSLVVVVSDTGVGIKDESMDKLFKAFSQSETHPVDAASKGTGLGLMIVKGIAEAHEGSVGMVSREGSGSSFFFALPIE